MSSFENLSIKIEDPSDFNQIELESLICDHAALKMKEQTTGAQMFLSNSLNLNMQRTLEVTSPARVDTDRGVKIAGQRRRSLKVRIYVPVDHSYINFFLLKIDSEVTVEQVIAQVLAHI